MGNMHTVNDLLDTRCVNLIFEVQEGTRGCVTAVQVILFNFANYSPSIGMELKARKLHGNDKIRDSRQTNMSPKHYF